MKLSRSDRHWKHWNRLHNSSHNRYLRMVDTWKRWFKVVPRGFQIDKHGGNFLLKNLDNSLDDVFVSDILTVWWLSDREKEKLTCQLNGTNLIRTAELNTVLSVANPAILLLSIM